MSPALAYLSALLASLSILTSMFLIYRHKDLLNTTTASAQAFPSINNVPKVQVPKGIFPSVHGCVLLTTPRYFSTDHRFPAAVLLTLYASMFLFVPIVTSCDQLWLRCFTLIEQLRAKLITTRALACRVAENHLTCNCSASSHITCTFSPARPTSLLLHFIRATRHFNAFIKGIYTF